MAQAPWEAVANILSLSMREMGFTRKYCTFYRYKKGVIHLVDVEVATKYLPLGFGIYLRQWDKKSHPGYYECHVRGYIQQLAEKDEIEKFCAVRVLKKETFDSIIAAEIFLGLIKRDILPFLDSVSSVDDFCIFLESPMAEKLIVDKDVKRVCLNEE